MLASVTYKLPSPSKALHHPPLIGIIVTQCNLLLRCVASYLISSGDIVTLLCAIIGSILLAACLPACLPDLLLFLSYNHHFAGGSIFVGTR